MNPEDIVRDLTGASGRITDVHGDQVQLRLEQGSTIAVPRQLLESDGEGYALPLTFSEAEQAGTEATTTVPVVEEVLDVGKRKTTSTVRVTKQVQEREAVVEAPAVHQEVAVERVPINRVVEGPLSTRVEGDTTVIPVLEEEVFIEKRWILREEIRITKTEVSRLERKSVVLKQESAHIEPWGD